MRTHLKWSEGNEKLKKLDTISFNLPAYKSADGFHVCPKAGGCASLCYARQGRYMMPSVAAPREFNLTKVRGNLQTFVREAVEDLQRLNNKIVRIHDSGDFFSQEYLDAWLSICRQLPDKVFYAYTKSMHLNFSKKPRNLKVVQSVGGLLDHKINRRKSHSRIFATVRDRKAAGYVDGNTNDLPAIRGDRKIGLVYHGTKNLKEGQVAWLSAAS